ncbi:hypothetical protein GPECTOR_165g157 [Gonium pectorale]|uniref:Trafficking protein particle complex subunit n=1 Tax=Gonium pectorale TaxID=33097 RepID=A0A150FXJ4_GONPE|nr:hypothetical protein GPECTOR_165g157 [Gonium pectorale]|eukprot:KXZ42297.1 hypothetical protein GPECTOR_165g157 [Gonium pectorale]
MSIYSLYVINKSGGLIYNRPGMLNDRRRSGHSLHAIASQLSPVPGCTGIELLEADTFNLHCFQARAGSGGTLTGTKFLLVVDPHASFIPTLLQRIYELYSDYVLKNPFYETEQVIKCELFDENVELLIRRYTQQAT